LSVVWRRLRHTVTRPVRRATGKRRVAEATDTTDRDATWGMPTGVARADRLLVPLDGSPAAEPALVFAELIPTQAVRLLLVEPDTMGPTLASAPEIETWREEQTRVAEAYLVQAGERLRRQGRQVETSFTFGDPATRIVEAADDADLVVMTTHGRGAGGRAIFGSVADRVARHAPTATMVVRGGARAMVPAPLIRLVVPLDGSPLAEEALPTALQLARHLRLPIHLVRVVDRETRFDSIRAGAAAATLAREEAQGYLDQWVQWFAERSVAADRGLLAGPPAVALLDVLRPGDLVVMTTHGRAGVRRWLLGSVADKLVRTSPGPVLIVRANQDRRHTGERAPAGAMERE